MEDPFVEILVPEDETSMPAAEVSARLPQFMGGPPDAAARLRGTKALVVGAGSLGFEFVQQLPRWQVEQIGVVDRARFKAESILTHGAPPEAVGQSKAIYAAQLAKRLSPRTRVLALEGEFASVPLSRLAEFDVVFLATDNLLAELQVSQACLPLRLPVVQGSVHGGTLSGHVRFFGHGESSSPCVACGFTAEEWSHLNANTFFSCEGHRSPTSPPGATGQPTMSVHALCSLLAQLGLLYFMRDRLALGAPVRDTSLEFCAYTQQITTTKLTRNLRCRCAHVMYRRVSPPRSLATCSVRELLRAAGVESEQGVRFDVADFYFVEQATCSCGAQQPVHRFARAAEHVGLCHECRRPLARHPFHSFRPVPVSALRESFEVPLHLLGAGEARSAVVGSGEDAVLFLDRSESAIP